MVTLAFGHGVLAMYPEDEDVVSDMIGLASTRPCEVCTPLEAQIPHHDGTMPFAVGIGSYARVVSFRAATAARLAV